MHGIGNDFIVINQMNAKYNLTKNTIQNLSNRHTGIGFDQVKNNIKDILSPYFTTKKKGTGLGFSIGNKIINDHNGELKFFSTNSGAKIEINFILNGN